MSNSTFSAIKYLGAPNAANRPTVLKLQRYLPPLSTASPCLEALNVFFADESLFALPVVDADNRPVGLIERHTFVEFFGRPFTREIHGRKTIAVLMAMTGTINAQPIVVESTTSIEDVANIIIQAGMINMVTGFIVAQDGRYAGVANGHDLLDEITQLKQADLYTLAHYDQLTGLPNRRLFADRLTHAILGAERTGCMTCLLLIDLDRLKHVNDSMGHPFGDALLQALAERLVTCARRNDTVARLGGDEFAIVMDSVNDPDEATVVAERVLDCVKTPFVLTGRKLYVTVSIGIATFPRDDLGLEGLLAKADAAMYQVKSDSRNGLRHYAPSVNVFSKERMSLETELRTALERNELVLHFQPRVHARDNRVTGVEALVRWNHPQRGLVAPGQFIAIAEECGLILGIGRWVLAEACRQHGLWRRAGLPPLRMAVNISPLQFRQTDFCDDVKAIIADTGMDPTLLELEMTESVVMRGSGSVMRTLEELKRIGVMLAIDDFGTGFSSLSYLRRFPVDRLKIDQSFVRDVDRMPVNKSIINAIIALAGSMSLKTTAEGVETHSELDLVKLCGCEEIQGYHFSCPLPPQAFEVWLAEFHAAGQPHTLSEQLEYGLVAPAIAGEFVTLPRK